MTLLPDLLFTASQAALRAIVPDLRELVKSPLKICLGRSAARAIKLADCFSLYGDVVECRRGKIQTIDSLPIDALQAINYSFHCHSGAIFIEVGNCLLPGGTTAPPCPGNLPSTQPIDRDISSIRCNTYHMIPSF